MVLEGTTIRQRRLALNTLPASLAEAFASMIDRIMKLPLGQAKLGMQVLLWLHMAYRPFKLRELRHALAVEPGDTELDTENIPSPEVILSCCLGLVIVDEETLTVRFVHYSLEEFFKDDENASKYFPDRFTAAAEICLTYLNFGQVSPNCQTYEELKRRLEEFAFLDYAANHWGHYVRLQSHNGVMELALNLLLVCTVNPVLHPAFQVLDVDGFEPSDTCGPKQFSGTHVAAYFGLHIYMPHLAVHDGWDMKDSYNRTPLAWAAEHGHKEVVQLLLTQEGVDVNAENIEGRAALSLAAERGYVAVVQLLLKQEGVDVNVKDPYGNTPLSWAAAEGHEAIVQLLITQEGVDVNEEDYDGRATLLCAADRGQAAVVQLLLKQEGVDVNAEDNMGRAALSWAAEWGHEAVVQLLLKHEGAAVNAKSDVDATGSKGRPVPEWTPLHFASQNGHETVVRLLLDQGADVNSQATDGMTPSSLAAANNHQGILHLLTRARMSIHKQLMG